MVQVRTVVSWGIILFFIALILPTALGAFLGSPAGVSYVETDSMSPKLSPGDGFILVPDEIAGAPEPGDVVVFRAEHLGGGGLTTHRLVRDTPRGFITRGDNNNAPDQAGQEPPVRREQIVGQPLRIDNHIIVIPKVGQIATISTNLIGAGRSEIDTVLWRLGIEDDFSTSQLSFLLFGILIIWYGLEWFLDRKFRQQSDRTYERNPTRGHTTEDPSHTILVSLILILVLTTTAAMVLPSGPQEYGVIASKSESPAFVIPGEERELRHGVGGTPVLPMITFLRGGEGVDIDNQKVYLERGEVTNVSATISVPPSVGYHRFYVVEHRYIPILPTDVIYALYQIHPWVPIAVIDAMLALSYYLIGRHAILSGAPVRHPSR